MVTPNTDTHYKLNDNAANTTVVDSGAGADNAVCQSNTSVVTATGKINAGFEGTGTVNVAEARSTAWATAYASDTTGSWTFWIFRHASGSSYFLNATDELAFEGLFVGHVNTNKFRIETFVAGVKKWEWQSDVGAFTLNGWVHLAIVHNGTSPIFYLNGQLHTGTFATNVDLTVWNADFTGMDALWIGCRHINGVGNSLMFDGIMDDYRYYSNTVLTAQDVLNIYNGGDGTEADPPNEWIASTGTSTQTIIIA